MFARRTSSTASVSASPQRLFKLPVFQLLALSVLLGFSAVSQAATFTVNTTVDTEDGVCTALTDGCSLRDAIVSATANGTVADSVVFNIPQSSPGYNASTGVYTILVSRGTMPVLPANITIDGTTQTSIANSNLLGPEIELTGYNSGISLGLTSPNGNAVIKGLIINGFGSPVHFSSVNNKVLGCYLGTDYTGTINSPNNNTGPTYTYGVNITSGGNSNTVGGLAPGDGNIIGFAAYNAVRITGTARYNRVRGNSIFGTVGIGIDLVDDGVDINDYLDVDSGANEKQNYPEITSVVPSSSSTSVSLTLNSAPNKAYSIDLYRIGAAYIHANGFAEGKTYAGSTTLNTDAGGNGYATINAAGVYPNDCYVATATDPTGNTSEFSFAITNKAGDVVTNTKDSGPGSLRSAITYAANHLNSTITFNIPTSDSGYNASTGVWTIAPQSDFPQIPVNTVIDASTQPGNSNPLGPEIELNGAVDNTSYCFKLYSGGDTIRGLIINGYEVPIYIQSSDNRIEGCYIGGDRTGTTASPNNYVIPNRYSNGIYLYSGIGNIIGGDTPAKGNVIGFAVYTGTGRGIYIGDSFNTVRNNTILGTYGVGMLIASNGNSNIVRDNIIRNCGNHGISMSLSAYGVQNSIRFNSIYNNGGLGIDLGGNGVSQNDVGDTSTALPNHGINFPVLTSSTASNTSSNIVTVIGSLNTRPGLKAEIDFYGNDAADSTGYGEGRYYLGTMTVTTDGSGNINFSKPLVGALGNTISATATIVDNPNRVDDDPYIGDTSEFSNNIAPQVSTIVTNTKDDGAGSLRAALQNAANQSARTITFNIPTSDSGYNASTGVWTIAPLSTLPLVPVGATIDGTTQPGNTNPLGPEIEIDGTAVTTTFGFSMNGGNSTIRGLIINGCEIPISIQSNNNRVESCYIGSDYTGTVGSAHNYVTRRYSNGIYIYSGTGNVIGGDTAAKGNIVGFTVYTGTGRGMYIGGSSGTIRNNTVLGNYGVGIHIANSGSSNLIRDNVIRNNGNQGVNLRLDGYGTNNTIRFNSIYSNGVLGIDLGGEGVTSNDVGDTSIAFPNHGINYPILTGVTQSNGSVIVTGTYNSRRSMSVDIDFYGNDLADSSGHGEGRYYLGTLNVFTDQNGNATFSKSLTGVLGSTISATATIIDNPNGSDDDPYVGDTSEFSNNVSLQSSIYLSSPTYSIGESGTYVTLVAVRSGSTAGRVTVDFTTGGGTATAGVDYTSSSSTISWEDGDARDKYFVMTPKPDTNDELDETFNVTLSNLVGNASLGTPSSAVVTIIDDDTADISANDISVVEGNSGTKTATFTVSLAAPSDRTVTVNYATANGTATAGSDYTATSGTLSFAPGQTSKTVNVTINGDTNTEAAETFFLNLSGATNAPITDNQAVCTITDDDASAVLSVNSTALAEGNTGSKTMAFTVKLTPASTKAVTFYAKTAPTASTATTEPATASTDFVALPLTAYTFNPGETSKTINITINGDTMDEANETFNLVLSSPTGATLGTATGIGTITDDDASPSASVNDVTLTEGDAGNQNAAFTVSLSAPSGRTVKVTVATVDVTTTAGADYNGITATELTFLPGQTSKVVNVLVKSDTISEATETFQVKLTNPVNVGFSDPTGVGTIVDNDPIPSISATVTNIAEGNSGQIVMPFSIRLSNPSSRAITFKVMTGNASVDAATAGVDYVAVPLTTLTIPAGTIQQVFNVQVNGDLADEVNEKVVLNLTASTNATITTAKVEGIIVDDDNAPSLSVTGGSLDEGNSGTKSLNFTVNLSSPSGKVVNVNFQTGTATAAGTGASTANTDYVAIPSTKLTFAPGEISKTVAVQVKGDIAYEADESFSGTIGSPVNATVVKATDAGIIRNDDNAPSLLYYASSVAEGNSGTKTVVLNLNLSAAAGTPVSFTYQTADETALAGEDYVAQTGTVTFTAGQTTRTLSIVTKGDTSFEANERFFVNFVDGQGVSVSYPITITNDDNSTARSGGSS